jgi:hypothetical protein
MPDEYCRALCELADDVHTAVSLLNAGDMPALARAVEHAEARAVSLSERLMRAFCPSLPRTETMLLVESLHVCALTVQLVALTRPPDPTHAAMGASPARLSAHLRQ